MQKLIWTNANGDSVDLTSGHYGITNWEGFSNTSLNIQTQQVPFQDGGVFLDALMEQRELTVTLAMNDEGSLETRYRLRRELIHILNPKLGEGYLIYKNDFTQKRIKCVPQIPLFETHNSDTVGTPKASLSWTACEPYWEDLEERTALLKNGYIENLLNEGDVKCGVNLIAWGNVTKLEIKSNNNNQQIIFNKPTQPEIQGLEITTDFGQKEVYGLTSNFEEGVIGIEGYKSRGVVYDKSTGWYFYGTETIYRTKDFVTKEKCESDSVYAGLKACHNGIVIAGGSIDSSRWVKSTDAFNFSRIQTLTSYTIVDIIYSEKFSKFIAVCNDGNLLASTDGDNWAQITTSLSVSKITEDYITKDLYIFSTEKTGSLYKIDTLEEFSATEIGVWTHVISDERFSSVQNFVISNQYAVIILNYGTSSGGIWNNCFSCHISLNEGSEGIENCQNIDIPIYQCEYIINENCFIAVSITTDGQYYTNKVYKSFDSKNWIFVKVLTESNSSSIGMYLAVNNDIETVIIFNQNYIYVGHSSDTVKLFCQNMQFNKAIYDEYYNKYILIGNYKTIYSTTDFVNYDKLYTFANVTDLATNNKGLILFIGGSGIAFTRDCVNFTILVEEDYAWGLIAYSPKWKKFTVVRSASRVFITDDLQIDTHIYETPLGDIGYQLTWCEGFDLLLTSLSYSEDGTNFQRLQGFGVNWSEMVVYSKERNMAIFSGHNGGIAITYDGKNQFPIPESNVFTDYDVLKGVYIDKYKLFVVAGVLGVHVSSDGKSWQSYNFGNTSRERGGGIFYFGDKILVLDYSSEKDVLEFTKSHNLIQYIQSNLELYLEPEENTLQVTVEPSSVSGSIVYRQKYIGV